MGTMKSHQKDCPRLAGGAAKTLTRSRLIRRALAVTLAALLLSGGAAVAQPAGGPSEGGFSSDNVEWLSTVPMPLPRSPRSPAAS
jgi:hypothetical protein